MFRGDTHAGPLYWLGHRDAEGNYLDGAKTYKLTVPLPVPGKLFWSVTVYDARTRSQVQTDQGKAVLSSLFDFLRPGRPSQSTSTSDRRRPSPAAAGPTGANPPRRRVVCLLPYLRAEPAAFDGSWERPDFERT